MKKADIAEYESIGFAAIGTGVMNYPREMVAEKMCNSIKEYSDRNPNCWVQHVHFVLYPRDEKTIKVILNYYLTLAMKENATYIL